MTLSTCLCPPQVPGSLSTCSGLSNCREVASDDMRLPVGKTCADCRHFKHCAWLIGCEPTNTNCDWSPSRFVEPDGTPEKASETHES